METTLNNIFKAKLAIATEQKNMRKLNEEKNLNEFLDEMKRIKKNLEDAFIGTDISVVMGMFGVKEPKYTTIAICGGNFNISGITSNNAVYHGCEWVNTTYEKDFRVGGKPYTYEELFTIVAENMV